MAKGCFLINWDNVSAPESAMSSSVKISTLTWGSPILVAIFDPTMINGSNSPSSSWVIADKVASGMPKLMSAAVFTTVLILLTFAL